MAVRQYVGARYVPQFYENSLGTAEWQQGVAYDPLTIVTLNGNSFTSKKSVPANIGQPNLNPEYWASTGIYNAQIDEYREETAQALQTAQNAATAATAAGTAAAAAQTAADDAQDTADEALATANAAQPKSEMTKYQAYRRAGTNIVFFGDSWAAGAGTADQTLRFTTKLAAALQMTEKNYSVGAAGFTRPLRIIDQVTNALQAMTQEERDNTGIALVLGGVNDIRYMSDTSMADFETAVSECINAMHAAFPNALIVAALCNTTNTGMTSTQWNWVSRAQQAARFNRSYPVMVIDNPTACIDGSTQYYQDDDLHPNAVGHQKLAAFLESAIMGGSTEEFRFLGTFTAESSVTLEAPYPHFFRFGQFVFTSPMRFVFPTPITANTLIGKLAPEFSPNSNIYMPFFTGGSVKGSICITHTGNVYAAPNGGDSLASGYAAPSFWLAASGA